MATKFRMGLTMAGAVSAGAYTGGVLDYLFQVLDAWQEAKAQNDPTVPGHELSLDIISGASAGGITGAMGVLALHMENRYAAVPDKRNDDNYLKKNVFYNAWVNLLQDDMLPYLLKSSDIVQNNKVVSVLNSQFIEKVAERTIVCLPECATAPPPYVNKKMQLILTLSNLNGFRYQLAFAAEGSSAHHMTQHRDYAFFRLGDTYEGLGRIPLNLQKDIGITELKEAALATGAFPVGLAYRRFVRKTKYILDNPHLVFYKKGITRFEDLDENKPEQEYVTYNVDGGMLNNEPFDLTMKLMAKESADPATKAAEELKKGEREFDSTIIMIDPFPSVDNKSFISLEESTQEALKADTIKTDHEPFRKFPYNLMEVVARIYRSMRGELLFKGEDIVEAFSRENFSRFMIAPRRRKKVLVNGEEREEILDGSVAIACGALDGFAGFFDKNFRRHDFFLGRANCQSFLRKYFRVKLENGVPVNPIFRDGYTPQAIERFKFQDEAEVRKQGAAAPWYVPIIPDVFQGNEAFDEHPLPYPTYNMSRFDPYRDSINERLKLIARQMITNGALRFAFNSWFFFRKGSLYKKLREKIEEHFRNWELL